MTTKEKITKEFKEMNDNANSLEKMILDWVIEQPSIGEIMRMYP